MVIHIQRQVCVFQAAVEVMHLMQLQSYAATESGSTRRGQDQDVAEIKHTMQITRYAAITTQFPRQESSQAVVEVTHTMRLPRYVAMVAQSSNTAKGQLAAEGLHTIQIRSYAAMVKGSVRQEFTQPVVEATRPTIQLPIYVAVAIFHFGSKLQGLSVVERPNTILAQDYVAMVPCGLRVAGYHVVAEGSNMTQIPSCVAMVAK